MRNTKKVLKLNLVFFNLLDVNKFGRIVFFALSCTLYGMFLLLPSAIDFSLAQPTQSSKTLLLCYIMPVVVVLYVFHILLTSNVIRQVKLSQVDMILFLLIVYLAANRYIFHEFQSFSLRFIDLIGLSLLYIILRGIPIKTYACLGLIVVHAGLLQAIYGVLQLSGYLPSLNEYFDVSGSYFNPGPFGGFLAMTSVVSLGIYLFRSNFFSIVYNNMITNNSSLYKSISTWCKIALISNLAISVFVLVLTFSRASWLAMLAGTTTLFVFQYNLVRKVRLLNTVKKSLLVITLFVLSASLLYSLYHFKKDSADGRFLVWKISASLIEQNLLVGVGFDRFKTHYMNAQANYFNQLPSTKESLVADNTYYALNDILQFTAENGILGLVIMIILIFNIFRSHVPLEYYFIKIWIYAILISIFIFGLFSYPAQILPIKMVLVFALAVLSKLSAKEVTLGITSLNKRVTINKFIRRAIKLPVIILVIIVYCRTYKSIYETEKGFRLWKNAKRTYNYGLYEKSSSEFERAFTLIGDDGDLLMNYGKALVLANHPEKAIQVLNRAQRTLNTTIIQTALGDAYKAIDKYQKSEKAYLLAADMVPSKFYPHYLLARLYEDTDQILKAKAKADEVLNKKVKIQSKAIEEIKAEMLRILQKKEYY